MLYLRLQGLEAFESLSDRELSTTSARKTIHVASFEEDASCFQVAGAWYQRERLGAITAGDIVGPQLVRGNETGIVLSSEAGRPPLGQVAVLTCRPSEPVERASGPFLLMLGGFDSPLTLLEGAVPTSFLTLAYPLPEGSKLQEILTSIDLPSEISEGAV